MSTKGVGHDQKSKQWWVYLITNFQPNVKTNSYVGVSTDPLADLTQHQSGAISLTRVSAASWRMELILGPMVREKSDEIRSLWTSKSRGIESRRSKGLRLHKALREEDQNSRCYDVEK